MSDKRQAYVAALVERLLERGREAKLEAERATLSGSEQADFQQGRSLAYYEVLDTARNLAISFGITDSAFTSLNLEHELLRSAKEKAAND